VREEEGGKCEKGRERVVRERRERERGGDKAVRK